MEKMILKMMALSFIIILSISTQVPAIQDDFEVKSTNIKVADNVGMCTLRIFEYTEVTDDELGDEIFNEFIKRQDETEE